MSNDDLIRLRHMADAAREALGFARGRIRADLDSDRVLLRALTKTIEIVGEAAASVSPEARSETPAIPWPGIVTMRNRLVHGYFDINKDYRLVHRHRGSADAARRVGQDPAGRPVVS